MLECNSDGVCPFSPSKESGVGGGQKSRQVVLVVGSVGERVRGVGEREGERERERESVVVRGEGRGGGQGEATEKGEVHQSVCVCYISNSIRSIVTC